MQDREYIRQQLKDGVVGTIFHTTTDSLFGRLSPTGYLPESLTGMYDGEYCRTIGAFVPLCLEMGRAKEARKALEFIFLSMERLGLEKIPHVLGLSADGNPYCISEEDQIDGRAHVVLAFAQYCLTTGDTSFADRYYDLACRETRTFSINHISITNRYGSIGHRPVCVLCLMLLLNIAGNSVAGLYSIS